MKLYNGIWFDHRNSKISPSHVPSIILVYSFNKMIIMNVMIFTKYPISKFCRLSGIAKSPLPICRIHGHWPPSAADLSRHQFKGGEGARSCQRESLPIFRSNKSLRNFLKNNKDLMTRIIRPSSKKLKVSLGNPSKTSPLTDNPQKKI